MKSLTLDLYKTLFLIRTAEEKIREYYPTDEIKSPTHLAIGEEAIATGVIAATAPHNQIFGTYRNHGIYLAKTGETDKFFGELFGKNTGLSKGKAGSMHIMYPEEDFSGTSAVVGSTIPVAVGAAFANQQQKTGKITVVFFGDGAIDEGAFWESINFACVKKLPVIFVCEDNSLAIHAHAHDRHGYKSIDAVVKGFDCHVLTSESTDVEEIYNLTKKGLDLQKKEQKPLFMYLKYYRYLEHVGIGQDFKFGYRSEDEYKEWLKKDPIDLQRKRLRETMQEEEVVKLEKEIIDEVEASIAKARKASFPPIKELITDVYA